MHTKRSRMPRTWPIERKGTTFVATPSHASSKGISLLFLLRNVLKIARTKKEVRNMTLQGMVQVNGRTRKSENFPVQVFDIISLTESKENYRLNIVNKKFSLEKVTGKEATTKVVKIIGKTTLRKGITQMNLDDGQNINTKETFSVGDSAVIENKTGKIEKILPLKKGANIEVLKGKHAGKRGSLAGFEELVRGKNYLIKLEDREVALPFKAILVVA